MASNATGEVIADQLLKAAEVVEQQLDAELQRLENLDDDDLESIRLKRVQQMKKQQKQKEDWLAAGHGTYTELSHERELFDAYKQSTRIVCHFYEDSNMACKIYDKHLSELAIKHIETRFLCLNSAKCPYFIQQLKLTKFPSLALIKDGKIIDYVRGISQEFQGDESFPVGWMEWRLGKSGIIHFDGNFAKAPWERADLSKGKSTKSVVKGNQSIKSSLRSSTAEGGNSDSDNDW